jgi:magnesium-transporting ATPase (P-type)
MSVLVRDAREDKYYVFVKGAPEKLKRQSINHIHEYDKMISRLSLSGLRTIAFGWKEVKPNNVQEYFQMEREEFDKNIYILGVIGF